LIAKALTIQPRKWSSAIAKPKRTDSFPARDLQFLDDRLHGRNRLSERLDNPREVFEIAAKSLDRA
jgi:hypothetical protein